jgi:hypothetical protein
MTAAIAIDGRVRRLADALVGFLETGEPPEGLFAPEVFCDFTLPHWRLQGLGVDELVALRRRGHPGPGRVVRRRLDETSTGFVLEFEERWNADGERWYARELARADIGEEGIEVRSVYCTGDWGAEREEAHRCTVRLLRP